MYAKSHENTALHEVLELAKEKGVLCQKVPLFKLNKITKKAHQNIIAFASPIHTLSLPNVIMAVFEKGETPLVLILDGIQDVGNFGAIIRTAECSGVHAIVVPSKDSAPISFDAMKASVGAMSYIPICKEFSLVGCTKYLKKSGLQVVACTEKGDKNLYDIDLNVPTAMIMGNEHEGISKALIEESDLKIHIPLAGKIGSLNVSVATGITLFEARRQRRI